MLTEMWASAFALLVSVGSHKHLNTPCMAKEQQTIYLSWSKLTCVQRRLIQSLNTSSYINDIILHASTCHMRRRQNLLCGPSAFFVAFLVNYYVIHFHSFPSISFPFPFISFHFLSFPFIPFHVHFVVLSCPFISFHSLSCSFRCPFMSFNLLSFCFMFLSFLFIPFIFHRLNEEAPGYYILPCSKLPAEKRMQLNLQDYRFFSGALWLSVVLYTLFYQNGTPPTEAVMILTVIHLGTFRLIWCFKASLETSQKIIRKTLWAFQALTKNWSLQAITLSPAHSRFQVQEISLGWSKLFTVRISNMITVRWTIIGSWRTTKHWTRHIISLFPKKLIYRSITDFCHYSLFQNNVLPLILTHAYENWSIWHLPTSDESRLGQPGFRSSNHRWAWAWDQSFSKIRQSQCSKSVQLHNYDRSWYRHYCTKNYMNFLQYKPLKLLGILS